MRGVILVLGLAVSFARAEPVPVRIVAANLTSGSYQSYSPDNGNHSNPEGAGARILKGLKPDVVLLQEFNTTMPAKQWVNATFGAGFSVYAEPEKQPGGIPNAIVSRWPIVENGEWEDVALPNRDFAWAKISLPNGRALWAISVHLYSKKPDVREKEARTLVALVKSKIPAGDLVVLGGDFNTKRRDEGCVRILGEIFDGRADPPTDEAGRSETNGPRNRPYDWVLADQELAACGVPTKVDAAELPHGLVFDSRVFASLPAVPPVQAGDSAAPNMQHMAVVRDFLVP